MNIIGEVNGKNVILIDDMIDTAGTITNAASALKERGAKEVYASCSHPVLSGPAIDRLNASPITEVVTPLHPNCAQELRQDQGALCCATFR